MRLNKTGCVLGITEQKYTAKYNVIILHYTFSYMKNVSVNYCRECYVS